MSASPVVSTFDAATGVATIAFNRPEVFNALDLASAKAFEQAVADLRGHAGLRCVVLTGTGKAFMAGGDVAAFAADLPAAPRTLADILRYMHPAILTLRELDAPIVAAVNGTAAGAGLSLVLGADYVIAKASARLVLAYDKLGVPPDCGGSWFLARKVGRPAAFELMLTGRILSAEEGCRLGVVNEVTADDDFADRVAATVARIAAGPTLAFGLFKRLLDSDLPLAAHLEQERQGFMTAAASEDFAAAATAFVRKETPVHRGR